jgi:hypothetical protein
MTKTDMDSIERDRDINNLNRALERPPSSERQMLGNVTHVACSGGAVKYSFTDGGRNFVFTSKDFQSIRMAVLLEGAHSFQIDCGVSFEKFMAVVSFRPTLGESVDLGGQLTSITFVPDYFKLKSAQEMASSRFIVVEDDTLKRELGVGDKINIVSEDRKPEQRWASIDAALRKPQSGENRATGLLEKVDCVGESVKLTALIDGSHQRFVSNSPASVKVAWFSAGNSQVSLACGSRPMAPNVLFTYRTPENFTGSTDGDLVALEFVPEGFAIRRP